MMRKQKSLSPALLFAIACSISMNASALAALTADEPQAASENTKISLSQDEKKKIFRTFIDLSFTGKSKQAHAMMDERMQTALPEEKMDFVVKQLQTMFGEYKSVESVSIEKSRKPGADDLRAWCIFANKSGDATATINAEGKLTSLFVKPHVDFASPQYAKHDLFDEEEVEFPSGKLTIKATLSQPKSEGPHPCLVLVHGSGPCDRDETVGAIKVFRDLAWGLASNGIAVLRYEKRTRQFPEAEINTVNDETVDDAIAAIEFLKTKSNIDTKRLFVLGHSLGALMVPRIADQEKTLAGAIICAGPTRKLEDIVVQQITYIESLKPDSKDSKDVSEAVKKVKEEAAAVKALDKDKPPADQKNLLGIKPSWWIDMQSYDQIKTAQSLTMPILVMQGQSDYQVTEEDFQGWQTGLKNSKNATFKIYPGLAHTLTVAGEKPGPSDYDKPQCVDETVIKDLCEWIKAAPGATP